MERDQVRFESEGMRHFQRGLDLEAAGRISDAIAAYREAVRVCPALPQAHFNLGVALALQGQTDEAIRAWQRAVWLKPEYMNDLMEALDLDHELRETVVNPRHGSSPPSRHLSLFGMKHGGIA